ncbi:hypothetical protein M9H77_31100 [Catharanthus roseus]|uniref:Uncharacterized protein n=1 Tax=Catharanthus roseus TaxID=4058 RepID=A0ACC0A1G2_CATRO|nr:hypothetical protein M9H77_31100 [Catharanthus roseus]
MVKVKNPNVGRGENYEEEGSSRGGRTGKGKGKRVASEVRLPKRVDCRDISFDGRMLNTILGTPENGIKVYAKNKKCVAPNLYSERRFEELFTEGEVLKRHDDRNVNKLDAYERLLHHMISNIIIPDVGHKSSITNMHYFVMLALHEHRMMNFGFMAIEHMLATQTSSTKFGDHIGIRKIYNKHNFKIMEFSRNEEGILVRGGQESDEKEEEHEGQDSMNVDEEVSEEELEEETFRREMKQKKRQERVEEGQSSGERSLNTTRLYEDEVIKLKTLKTRIMVRDSFIRYL